MTCVRKPLTAICLEVLKLSEETDLDVLNHTMEVIVEHYSAELLPVATQLTARLVSSLRYQKESTHLSAVSNLSSLAARSECSHKRTRDHDR
jgi:hypothetical protein